MKDVIQNLLVKLHIISNICIHFGNAKILIEIILQWSYRKLKGNSSQYYQYQYSVVLVDQSYTSPSWIPIVLITNITAKSWKCNIDIMKGLYDRVIRLILVCKLIRDESGQAEQPQNKYKNLVLADVKHFFETGVREQRSLCASLRP